MKVFILGANGMLGTYASKFLKSKYDVIPLTRADYGDQATSVSIIDFLKDKVSVKDVIINCIGAIKQKDYSITESINLNSVIPLHLSILKQMFDCNIIHITTDCVFDGQSGWYNELSIANAKDVYGITKYNGEYTNLTIIRTSIIGEENKGKLSLIEWVKSNKNSSINGYINHIWNGVTCLELCREIDKIINKGILWNGVKHYYTSQHITKYSLVKIINDVYKLNNEVIPVESEQPINRALQSIHYGTRIIKPYKQQIEELFNYSID
jgi:dTDP-4-dehydrorhamnose reductase